MTPDERETIRVRALTRPEKAQRREGRHIGIARMETAAAMQASARMIGLAADSGHCARA
jgi:hypothetical protein